MNEKNIEGFDELKQLFEGILGIPVEMEYDLKTIKKEIFNSIITDLEILHIDENIIYENTKIDLSSITGRHFEVIEKLLLFTFGEKAYDLIMWYIFERKAPDGTIIKLEDQHGNIYELNDPEQLWDYINTKLI